MDHWRTTTAVGGTARVAIIISLLALSILQHDASCFVIPSRLPQQQLLQKQQNDNDQNRRLLSNAVHSKPIVSVCYLKKTAVLDRDDVDEENDDSSIATIQILMSDTGGGHRASANALRDAFDVLYPGRIQCDIVDIYTDYGPFWPFNDYVNMYKLMAKNPWSWDAFYQFGSTPFGLALNEFLLRTFCLEPFTKCIDRPQPGTGKRADMVLSVHPLTQDIPLQILGRLDSPQGDRTWQSRSKTPFVTVVTDLGSAHPTWFHRGVDKCFVPSPALDQAARNRGLSSPQIVQYGLPIRKGFWNEYNSNDGSSTTVLSTEQKQKLRAELGIQPDLQTVLVVGGGDGMGGLVDISKALGEQLGSRTKVSSSSSPSFCTTQIVIVCGNNQDAKQQLMQHPWPSNVNVIVKGFVNNMDEWMKSADVLVTKAGPGTIAEASICGLPCMMFSFLYV